MPQTLFGLPIKPEIDIGHFLTFVTLVAGFGWWLVTTIHTWRKASLTEAKSGALRFLLWILRENADRAMPLAELRDKFNAPDKKARRKAYCGRNYRFANEHEFEAAVYRLDWEGHIDFVGPNAIQFRVDRPAHEAEGKLLLDANESARIVAVFESALNDSSKDRWNLVSLAQSAFRVRPDETRQIVQSALNNSDARKNERAVEILGHLVR